MNKRIKILGGVMVGMLVVATIYLAGTMNASGQYSDMLVAQQNTIFEQQTTISNQQEELDRINRERQGLDENGVRIDRMAAYYEESDGYSTANALFHTDAEFLRYCQNYRPEAVYFSSEWTEDEVILSYRDHPEIWAYWSDQHQMTGFYYTWTPNYEHCFILDVGYSVEQESYEELNGGWLVVDGVRVRAFGKETGPIDPLTLLEEYQNGTWDGSSRMSPDWSTTAYIDSDGRLVYSYSAYVYDATMDPEGRAYTGYEEPWWTAEDLDPEIAALLEDAKYRPVDGTPRGWSFAYGSVDVNLYVDLPTDYDASEFFRVCRFWKDEMSFCLAPTRVVLAQKGEILTEWALDAVGAIEGSGSGSGSGSEGGSGSGSGSEGSSGSGSEGGSGSGSEGSSGSGSEGGSGSVTEYVPSEKKSYQLLQTSERQAREHPEDVAYLRNGDKLWALCEDGTVRLVLETIIRRSESNPDRIWGLQGDKLLYFEGATYYRSPDGPYLVAEGVLETDFSTAAKLVRKANGCYVVMWNTDTHEYYLEYLGAGLLESYQRQSKLLNDARWRS